MSEVNEMLHQDIVKEAGVNMKTVYVRVGGLSDQLYYDFLKHVAMWEINHQCEKISCLISTKPITDALKEAEAGGK